MKHLNMVCLVVAVAATAYAAWLTTTLDERVDERIRLHEKKTVQNLRTKLDPLFAAVATGLPPQLRAKLPADGLAADPATFEELIVPIMLLADHMQVGD